MSPTVVGFIAGAMWIVSALLVSLAKTMPPFELMTFTWIIALVILCIYTAAKGRNILQQWKRPASDYILVTTGVTMNVIFYYLALFYAPPFEANALNYLWPILLIAFIDLSEKNPVNLRKLSGMVLGFGGCVMLLVVRSGSFQFESLSIGHVYALLGAITWASYSTLAKGRTYATGFMIPIFFTAFLVCLCISLGTEQWIWPSVYEWTLIATLGVIRVSYVFWDYSVRFGDRVLLTSASYFIPLFSTLLLLAAGFGTSNPLIMLAAGFIIAGCLVVNADKIAQVYRTRRQ